MSLRKLAITSLPLRFARKQGFDYCSEPPFEDDQYTSIRFRPEDAHGRVSRWTP
jgi:hypothetical protein